jgi:hypothetical protein
MRRQNQLLILENLNTSQLNFGFVTTFCARFTISPPNKENQQKKNPKFFSLSRHNPAEAALF